MVVEVNGADGGDGEVESCRDPNNEGELQGLGATLNFVYGGLTDQKSCRV